MINVKEKNKIKESHKIIKKNNNTILKKTVISSLVILGLVFSLDTGLSLSNGVKKSNTVDQRISYYNTLSDYSVFSKKMDNVPYTQDDFKKDLSLFDLVYNKTEGNRVFQTYYRTSTIDAFINMKYTHNDQDKVKQIINASNKISYNQFYNQPLYFENDKAKIDKDEKVENFLNIAKPEAASYTQKMDVALIKDSLKNNYMDTNYFSESIYKNTEKYLKAHSINPNILFISPETSLSYIKSQQYFLNPKDNINRENVAKINRIKEDSFKEIEIAYQNKDEKKLYDFFKSLNAFYTLNVKERPHDRPEYQSVILDKVNVNVNNIPYPASFVLENKVDDIRNDFSSSQKGTFLGNDSESYRRNNLFFY